jgi:hypothetical protein
MTKRDDTAAETDDMAASGAKSTRQRKTDSSNAAVRVESAHGTREVRMIDFLRELTDDGVSFERVGAMAVGDEVEIHRGAVLVSTVRRIR